MNRQKGNAILLVVGVLIAWASTVSLGQSSKNAGVMGMNLRYGYLLNHSPEVTRDLSGKQPRGVELFYHIRTDGDKAWHEVYNYPEIGFAFHYFDMNDDRLGSAFAFTPYIQIFPMRKERHMLSFKLGPGLHYGTKPYDAETNPENLFYSTHLNVTLETNFLYHYQLSPHWRLQTGLSFTHYSNGAFNLPNKGANTVSYNLGMAYIPKPDNYKLRKDLEFTYRKGWNFDVYTGFAMKMANYSDTTRDFAYTLSLAANKRVSRRSALVFGVDMFYTESIQDMVEEPDPNFYRVSLTAGHELMISKFSLMTVMGVYVYRPYKVDKPIFQRYSLRYYLNDNFFALWRLKSHYAKADVVELGFGFRFRKSRS
ncbi:acyloxyacyl hydrolase [Rapidithrix thailandica]|uniref:Acyloxyacyl hydrolase n=1 Tax=Rapidithrix thailandica TaxID=413964 RepID=A0AAW9SA20_9BACT